MDFGDGDWQHGGLEEGEGVEAETLPRASPAGSARPLDSLNPKPHQDRGGGWGRGLENVVISRERGAHTLSVASIKSLASLELTLQVLVETGHFFGFGFGLGDDITMMTSP